MSCWHPDDLVYMTSAPVSTGTASYVELKKCWGCAREGVTAFDKAPCGFAGVKLWHREGQWGLSLDRMEPVRAAPPNGDHLLNRELVLQVVCPMSAGVDPYKGSKNCMLV